MATKVITHFITKPKSIDEHIEAGKALREKHPIIQLRQYIPPVNRVAILEKQGETRLQVLVPIRYLRMLASPFAFLKGGLCHHSRSK